MRYVGNLVALRISFGLAHGSADVEFFDPFYLGMKMLLHFRANNVRRITTTTELLATMRH